MWIPSGVRAGPQRGRRGRTPALVNRSDVLEQLADLIVSVTRPHPLRIAIDGVDAAGKTTLADELVKPIEQRGRPVIRASIDGFHRPRADRYRRGAGSAEGYYRDSFDHEAVRSALLAPLGPDGSLRYRTAVFDFRSDSTICEPLRRAAADAVLLFDGVFLLRPELNDCWDYRVFVRVDLQMAVCRAFDRDRALFGTADAARTRFLTRYIPGQRIYLRTVRPEEHTNVVVENDDPGNPNLIVVDQPP